MTETVSHIAVKQLNGFKSSKPNLTFKTLPGVNISKDERDCLVIEAPRISKQKIVTNDIVKITDESSFEWLGRYDNVINSGGIKLYPEVIESKLQDVISERFFVTSMPDDTLGEKLVLVVESQKNKSLEKTTFKGLDKYEVPKEIIIVPKFVESISGKVQRCKTLQLVK